MNWAQSEWSGVISSVPKDLSWVHCSSYTSTMLMKASWVGSVLKFADDTKLFRKVSTPEDAFGLQDDLGRLFSGLKTEKCHSTLRNVSVFTLATGTSSTTTTLVIAEIRQ